MDRKGFSAFVLVAIIGILLIGGIGYSVVRQRASRPATPLVALAPNASPSVPPSWKTYTSRQYGFSLRYPEDWIIKDIASKNDNGLIALISPSSTDYDNQHPGGWPIGDLFVSIDQNPKGLSAQSYYNGKNGPGLFGPYDPAVATSTSVGGAAAYYVVPRDPNIGSVVEIIIPSSGFFIRVEEIERFFDADAPVFKEILSSFAFAPEPTSYTACGCGCCGDVTPSKPVCLYRSKGDSLQAIIAQDREDAKSPQCATLGCSFGVLYKYCD